MEPGQYQDGGLLELPLDRNFLKAVDFTQMPIIPPQKELFGQTHWQQIHQLPINKVQGAKYESAHEYLATHFVLLREDCMHNFCQGIRAMSQNEPAVIAHHRLDLHLYPDVRLHSICCGKLGIEHCLLVPSRWFAEDSSGPSKCLREGSLICLSDDGFQTLVWGIVSRPIRVSIDGRITQVKLLNDIGYPNQLFYERRYVIMESPPAFYEAYCHVLRNLQKGEMVVHLPFGEHLVFLEPQVDAPDYLREGDEYDFSSVFPEMENQLGSCLFPVLEKWPEWKSSLDPSQIKAIRHGVTKRLALIQGPPGTGKTFVGTIIVDILLNNMQKPAKNFIRDGSKKRKLEIQEQMDGPLLVLCYTNHALDQFLEGILEFEENLVRYGGRSTSSKLARCTVKQKTKEAKRDILKTKWNRHRSLCRKSDMLRADILRCHAALRLDQVTFTFLSDVATNEQMERLYFCGPFSKTIQLWLEGLDMQSVCLCIQAEERDQKTKEGLTESICAALSGSKEEVAETEADFDFEEPYVWTLGKASRRSLHAEWLKRIKDRAQSKLCELTAAYQSLCALKAKVSEDIEYSALSSARVVGMTTTAAARCHGMLMRLRPKIVIVEEAAEILEGHIIACLTPYTEHLILIGDHLQLRPSVAVNRLASGHNLDVSLFERLISGGLEHVTLNYQRRMRPCISRLLHSIYPALRDHDSVFGRRNVEGLLNNVFFLDHRLQEGRALGSRSKMNQEESFFVIQLYLYILKQGSYKTSDVTILTMYRAQVECIKTLFQERAQQDFTADSENASLLSSTRVTCVDDFQGEESNIIILSLVRNISSEKDVESSIGFLESSNRVCVALSRAREGLYIFGNADLLSSKSQLWRDIVHNLRTANALGSFLTLICNNHFPGLETVIHEARDFRKVMDGGCGNRCNHLLDCGHKCPMLCHPGGHALIVCPQRCLRAFYCGHRCLQKCHGSADCPPCVQKVPRKHPLCGHPALIPCSFRGPFRCEEPCNAKLGCGHMCPQRCGQKCGERCTKKIKKTLPCGHIATLPCYQPADKYFCQVECGQSFEPVCRHSCQGKCSSCRQNTSHLQCCKPCERILPCGHKCKALCHQTCQPCSRPCENVCRHRRCQRQCGDQCQPCEEQCRWNCEHFQCSLKCDQVCDRQRCNRKCPEMLKCGHECIGLCGDPCPIRCRICNPNVVEICSGLTLKEMETSTRFVELSDCGHLAEYTMLDSMIDMLEPSLVSVKSTTWPKCCPKCETPIRTTLRYKGVINSILGRLEESKKMIMEKHHWASNTGHAF